jgi:predicted nucleotide-binding protein
MLVENCKYCNGTGRDPNSTTFSGYKPCPVCEGRLKRTLDMPKDQLSDCSYCNGTGRDPNSTMFSGYKPCPICKGWGSTAMTSGCLSKPNEDTTSKVELKKKHYSNKVFIVHGHDDLPKERLAHILLDLGLVPIILHDQPNRGRTLMEKFEEEACDVGYAFVIMTPDDFGIEKRLYEDIQKGIKQGGLCLRPRQNVVLELGFFYGKLGRNRVCCLTKGDVEKPSDFLGIVYLPFVNKVDEVYRDIVKELRALDYSLKSP